MGVGKNLSKYAAAAVRALRSDIETRSIDSPPSVQSWAASTGAGSKLACYFARYNCVSAVDPDFDEVILPGAFDPAIKRGGIRCLFNHLRDAPLGIQGVNLRLWTDQYGLAGILDVPPTTLGRDTAVLVARGILPGCSFSFFSDALDSWSYTQGRRLRTIRSFPTLGDVSVVLDPAYPVSSAVCGTTPIARSGYVNFDADRLRILELAISP